MSKEKITIGYNTAFVLTTLIGRLILPLSTLDEFDKIRILKDKIDLVKEEYLTKLRELLKIKGIKELTTEHSNYNEIVLEINNLFSSGSSLFVEELQQYSREEVATMINGAKDKFDIDEFSLIMTVLVKNND